MLPRFWYKREVLSYLLLPFALVYWVLIRLYRVYCHKLLALKLPVPIIVVGNITVGGTGKTPLVIYLAELLKKHGYHPGIISRGYGRSNAALWVSVTPNSTAGEVGDEALLISRRTACPVIVAKDRVIAAKKILELYKCDIIISDDGLQHYKLPRYIEIAVVDATFKFGNALWLPAGPLREPIRRLRHVDFVVKNFNTCLPALPPEREYMMVLTPSICRNVKFPITTKSIEEFKGYPVHAVAAIGMPQKFFQTLHQLGLNIIEHPFPDHFQFNLNDSPVAQETVIMTEKDAVKCDRINSENCWYLEVGVRIDDRFESKLLNKLSRYPGFSCN